MIASPDALHFFTDFFNDAGTLVTQYKRPF
jgi:hypothetical protein